MNNCGVIYVAVDPETSPSPFKFNSSKKSILRDVLSSINSLKKSNPNLNVTVFSDFDKELFSESSVDKIIPIKNDFGFIPKVFGIKNSPYKKTIFLDCDTYVAQDISCLFNELESFDFCVGTEFLDKQILNTGVLAFNKKNNSLLNFLDLWLDQMLSTKAKAISDQKKFSNKTPDDQGCFNGILRMQHKNPDGKPYFIKNMINISKSLHWNILDNKIWNCRNTQYKHLLESDWDFNQTKIFHIRGFNGHR